MKRKLLALSAILLMVCAVTVVAQRINKHGGLIDVLSTGAISLVPRSGQAVAVTGPLTVSGGITEAASQTLAVTTADKLTVGGVIVPQTLTVTYRCQAAATCVTSHFFIADAAYQVTAVNAVWSTAEATATNLRVQVEKLTGTTAPGSGTALLTNNTNAGISIKGTANTVTVGTLTGTTANLQLASGNRLGIKFEDVATEGTGVIITITLKRI